MITYKKSISHSFSFSGDSTKVNKFYFKWKERLLLFSQSLENKNQVIYVTRHAEDVLLKQDDSQNKKDTQKFYFIPNKI